LGKTKTCDELYLHTVVCYPLFHVPFSIYILSYIHKFSDSKNVHM
jgi:hypothetical protein